MQCPLCRASRPAGCRTPATWLVDHVRVAHPREWAQHISVEKNAAVWVGELDRQMAAAA